MLKRLRTGEPTRRVNRIGRDGRICTERIVDNEVPRLIPVIARLCLASSSDLQTVYLCHPSVQHVHRGTKPGHFCGYRNIQMLVSFIQGTKAKGHERFGTDLPGILQIQDLIEEAWDGDPYNLGRQETGGIRNTRKWIGTPEVGKIQLWRSPSLSDSGPGGFYLQASISQSLRALLQRREKQEST